MERLSRSASTIASWSYDGIVQMTSAFRYCALIWNVADSAAQSRAASVLDLLPDALPGWDVNLDAPGFKVLSKIPTDGAFRAYALARQSGVVLGTLFPT